MFSKPKKIKRFQIEFLKFLNEKNVPEVHIYHHVMNYWSNDQSMISLQELKEAITDLCNEKMITSKNNAHVSIGAQGVPEEDQKNNAVCTMLPAGQKFLRTTALKKTIKAILIILLILLAVYSIWHFKPFAYFFR